MMFLRKSTINDIKELTAISIKAFGSDIQVGGKEAGGPPDYDSESWHRKMMEQNHLYTFWNIDESIVGGAVLFGAEELFVGRIFIDPRYFRQGYGMKLMMEIEDLFHSKIIKLDTPIWNERTNRFYKKCGYTEIGRDDESVYYEKRASQSSACTQRAL